MKTTSKSNFQTLYATNGSLIKDFISRKEFLFDESLERRLAYESQYGFITALVDGFISDGNKKVILYNSARNSSP